MRITARKHEVKVMNKKILAIVVSIAMLMSALSVFTYAVDVEIDLSDLFGPEDSEPEPPNEGEDNKTDDGKEENKEDFSGSTDDKDDDKDDDKEDGNDKDTSSTKPSTKPSSNKGNSSSKNNDDEDDEDEKVEEKTDDEKTDEEKTEEPKEWVNPFSDVKDGIWFYDTVKYVTENGIMNGVEEGKFAPDNTLTRAMLVTILYRVEGSPEVSAESKFTDVKGSDWYGAPIVWASENGIVNGVSETEFAPNNNITREQIAAIIYRYASAKGYDVTRGGMAVREFEDYETISGWAKEAMQWAVNAKLISGTTPTTVAPLENATRAQAATIIMRFIEANK